MRFRSIFLAVAIASVSSLVTWQWASAQDTLRAPGVQTFEQLGLQTADIKSGSDIGFRVDRMERNRAMGRLVVRLNGQWVDAEFSMRVSPLSQR